MRRAAATAVAKMKTPAAAIGHLERSLGNAKGAHELDDALARLEKLGYTNES